MHDEPKPWIEVPQPTSSARALRRVAEALGVPAASFVGVDADAGSDDGPAGRDEAAVLATVRSYLGRASPAARERFILAVRTMAETTPR